MAGVIHLSDFFGILRQKVVGDTTDRLVNLCSLLSLICCTINIGQQIIGKPMTCTSKYDRDYVNLLCYTKPFYHVPLEDHSIRLGGREEYYKINYFQFLALAFFTQAAVLYIPSYLWKKTYKKADIKLGNIVKTAIEIRDGTDGRFLKISAMGATILKTYKIRIKVGCNSYWKMIKNALILRYLAMKIANAFLLAYFINNVSTYLSNDFWWSGEHLIGYLKGEEWIDSEQFPRLAYCDFAMRDMANVKSITAQCVLAMNFISEKLFFVEWIWFTFVFVLLLLNIAAFFFSLIRRRAKISEWLCRQIKTENITQFNRFHHELIGWDGYLTIYLVECAAGVDIASDFTVHLYEQFITMASEASYSNQLSITLVLS